VSPGALTEPADRPADPPGARAASRAVAGAVVYCLAAAAFDVATGRTDVFIAPQILGPIAASAWASARRTALVAVLAVTLAVLLGLPDHIFAQPGHLWRVALVLVGAVMAVGVAAARERRERDLTGAREAAIMERQRRREAEASERLHALAAALAAAATPDEVAGAALDIVAQRLGVDAAMIGGLTASDTIRFEHAFGYPEAALAATREVLLELDLPVPRAVRTRTAAFLAEPADPAPPGQPGHDPVRGRFAATAILPLVVSGQPTGALILAWDTPRHFGPDERALLLSVAGQTAQAFERARLTRLEVEATQRAVRLQHLSSELSRAATPEEVAATAIAVGSAALGASGGLLGVATENRTRLRCVAASGYPADLALVGAEIRADVSTPAAIALRSGEPFFGRDAAETLARFPVVGRRLLDAGNSAIAALPLVTGGSPFGAIAFTFTEPRRFSPAEQRFLETLAGLCSQAMERAQLYARSMAVSETLQRSLLPDGLPVIPGLEVVVRYLPGTADVEVGGDFYDVFPLPDGRVALVLGDVIGRGVRAASLMGRIRNGLRTAAWTTGGVAAALAAVDRTMLAFDGVEDLVTVVIGAYDAGSGGLELASAGHLPTLVTGPEGSRFHPPSGAPPLGAGRPEARAGWPSHLAISAGQTLVLFSDGLVEDRRRPLEDGLEALASSAATHLGPAELSDGGLDAAVDRVISDLLGSTRRQDDVAVLAARRAVSA